MLQNYCYNEKDKHTIDDPKYVFDGHKKTKKVINIFSPETDWYFWLCATYIFSRVPLLYKRVSDAYSAIKKSTQSNLLLNHLSTDRTCNPGLWGSRSWTPVSRSQRLPRKGPGMQFLIYWCLLQKAMFYLYKICINYVSKAFDIVKQQDLFNIFCMKTL